jgi:Hydrazine synthase alpha subunit middle domain
LAFLSAASATPAAAPADVEADWLRQAGGDLDVRPVVARAHRNAEVLRRSGVDTRDAEAALAAAAARAERLAAGAPVAERREAYFAARRVARRLALAGPLLSFDRLLIVKRFTQEAYPDVCLNHMPWVSRPGGDLCVLTNWKADGPAEVRPLLAGRLGPGHVHGAELWWHGDRVVFGYAKTKTDQPPAGWLDRSTSYRLRRTEEPTHIFEVRTDGAGLRQITRGEWSDLDPTYLPNGDIAFVSERCACSLQCNELDKDETSCNLYVMRPDGSDIRRLSASKDGDYLPHALDDGTIGYTRWEYQERGWANIQSIWTIRPDGTGSDALFKQHVNDPWSLEDVRSVPGSRKLAAIATGHHCLAAGPVVVIDAQRGMNNTSAITIVTPGVKPPEGGMSGTPAPEGGVVDHGGHYMTPWPLSETTFLAAYTYGPQNDPAGYGIYLVDVYGTKELVYRDPAISCSVPAPLRPRPRPPVLPDLTDRSQGYAVCSLANVGHGVDGVAPGVAKYLRIAEGLYWPYDNSDGGQRYEPDVKSVMINWNPVRIVGEVPIERDGSAYFRVPVDTPVYFQLLDADHMELRRMRSFVSFQAGEQRGCTGCHESREETPSSAIGPAPLALSRAPSTPAPPPWGDRAISFLRDVQPLFDKHCASCHAGLKPAAGLDFSGGLTASYNRAYDTLYAKKLVAWSNVGDDARVTQPMAFGSHQSKLVQVLRTGACASRAVLDRDEWTRLVTWIDANAPYHDGFINKRSQPQPYDLPNDRDLVGKITAVHARRCTSCHQPSDVSRLDWVDLNDPRQSRFLRAPLAGSGRCSSPTYKDATDPDYQALAALVGTAAKRAWDFPRRDLKSLPRPR